MSNKKKDTDPPKPVELERRVMPAGTLDWPEFLVAPAREDAVS